MHEYQILIQQKLVHQTDDGYPTGWRMKTGFLEVYTSSIQKLARL